MLNRRSKSAGEFASEVEANISSPVEEVKSPLLYIPTGSAMLNLACSDRIDGGYKAGKIVNLIGDSSSGKSILVLTGLAEMCYMSRFDKHRLVLDDAERANEFDIEELFGSELVNRLEVMDEDASETIEEFYGNVLVELDKPEPVIYVLDSFDSLTSEAEQERSVAYKKKKKDKKGSYKTEKPRMASEILRVIKGRVADSKSLVLIVSQTRDNIGFGAMFQPKTRSGGKALKFYSTHEIWLAVLQAEKSKGLNIGNWVGAKVTKNKLTGKKRDVTFPIFYDYGVDDIGSCVDFLLESVHWKKIKPKKESKKRKLLTDEEKKKQKGSQKIDAVEFDIQATKAKLISSIEDEGLVDDLFDIVQQVWNNREDSVKLKRKRRFAR